MNNLEIDNKFSTEQIKAIEVKLDSLLDYLDVACVYRDNKLKIVAKKCGTCLHNKECEKKIKSSLIICDDWI